MRLFSDQKTLLMKVYQSQTALASSLADEAIAMAYRRIANALDWSYLHRRTQIVTSAKFTTGTVSYTASTRVVTLTGGTWPTWARFGLILLNGSVYRVQSVTDSTHLILTVDRSPTVNITAGSSFSMFQAEYVLPDNFVRLEELVPIGQWWLLHERQPGSLLSTARVFTSPSRPWEFTIRGSSYFPGRLAIEFGPPPDAVYTIDMSYFARPRQRTLPAEYKTGTVSVTGTAVVGTGTAFTQAMVGCQLRQGTADNLPAGEYGPLGSTSENTIDVVTDATHITLLDAGATSTSVMFMIDDPIDLDRGAMDEAFCRMCEHQMETLFHGENRAEKQKEVRDALLNARAADVRVSPGNQMGGAFPGLDAIAAAGVRGR